jgi:hypothetical protein
MLRVPHCLDNRLTDGGKHYNFYVSDAFLLEVEQTPGPSAGGGIR